MTHQRAHLDIEDIDVPDLPEGADEPNEGMLDPKDRYLEGDTYEWLRDR